MIEMAVRMNRFSLMYQLVLADFKERTRSYSFMLTMLGALFFGYLVITDKYSIRFSDYRCDYDSTWVGSLLSVCCTIMFVIAGFYLVKNSIGRDRRTEVGQILATTPLTNVDYLISKFISNISVLWAMVLMVWLFGLVTLLFLPESGSFELLAYTIPFLLIPAPAMVMVAAMAVFFETIRWLRGSIGNVLYLFVAEISLVAGMFKAGGLDFAGVSVFMESVQAAILKVYPGVKIAFEAGFIGAAKSDVTASNAFHWDGIDWTTEAILLRMVWIGVAGGMIVLALPFFDRFDPSRGRRKITDKKISSESSDLSPDMLKSKPRPGYGQIARVELDFSFVRMLRTELRLMLKGLPWVWYLVAVAPVVAQLVTPFEIGRMYLGPFSMVWPLVIWSSMGTRERRYDTGQLLFSSPQPIRRQFPAMLVGGTLVAVAALGGMMIRAVLNGDWQYLATLIVGALFVPAFALSMGTLSGSKKMFEVLYLMLWYIGPINHVEVFDFLGTTAGAIYSEKLIIYLVLTIVMWGVALIARRRQVTNPDR